MFKDTVEKLCLKKIMFKMSDEKICNKRVSKYIAIAFDFFWFLMVANEWIKGVVFLFFFFSFFPNFDLLARAYSRWKKNGCNIQTKGQKIVNWHKNRCFSVAFKGKGCNYDMCTKSRICSGYIFVTVYHIFIRHYIFKERIGKYN